MIPSAVSVASLRSVVTRPLKQRLRRWAIESYQKNWRQPPSRSLLTLGLTFLKEPRWFTHGSTAEFYTAKTPYATDLATPLWSNLGYWKDARTTVDAQMALARLLADAVQLGPGNELLDVGCGSGDQDLLWCRERQPRRIAGVEITPVRADLANRRAAAAGLADRIHVEVGSATKLDAPDCSFDKVTALECAMHFDTRERFFSEAFRVLRPGGRLGLADIAAGPDRARGGSFAATLVQRATRRVSSIPEANVYSIDTYRDKLNAQGFRDIEIVSIGDHVFAGCISYRAMLAGGGTYADPVSLTDGDFHAEQWNSQWRDGLGLGEYIIVSARRPGKGEHAPV